MSKKSDRSDRVTEKKLKAYTDWAESEYLIIVDPSRLKEFAVKNKISWLSSSLTHFNPILGNFWRYASLMNLTYLLPVKKYEYSTTVMSISRKKSFSGTFRKAKGKQTIQFHTNYAFLYSSRDDGGSDGNFHFDYLSMGHTFKSADGEYRYRFIPVAQFNEVYTRHAHVIEPYERYIIKQAKRGEFTLKSGIHMPADTSNRKSAQDNERKAFEQQLDASRLVLRIYVIIFIIEAVGKLEGYISNHINDGYLDAMFGDADFKEFEKIYAQQDKNYVTSLRLRMTTLMGRTGSFTDTMCGQKIIPLRAKEVEDLENIRYDTWREIYISSFIGDLVINNVAPGFPLFKDYTLLYADPEQAKDFYDNQVNHIKLDHSSTAAKIVRDLEGVRRSTFVVDPIKKKELYISYKFEGLSDTIEMPMDYAEKNLIMANYAVCMLNENVGRTFGDLPRMMKIKPMRLRIGPIFSKVMFFGKLAFEYIYNLYAANLRAGVIHTDLHINNATTFDRKKLIETNTGVFQPGVTNPHIIYEVHGTPYVFPHIGRYGCIIDFSRGIISEEQLSKTFPKRVVHDIISKEKKRVLQKYETFFPDFFRDNESALRAAVEDLFPVVFKIFSAIDMFIFSQGAMQMIKMHILGDADNLATFGDREVIENQIMPLLQKIYDIAFEQLTGQMFKVITRKISKPEDLEWPNAILIRDCFAYAKADAYNPSTSFAGTPYASENTDGHVTLVDYFVLDNPMPYNIRDYEKFPPICKLDKAIEMKLSIADIMIENWDNYKQYLAQESLEDKTEKIKKEAREERDERRGVNMTPTKKDKELIKTEPGFSSEEIYYDT